MVGECVFFFSVFLLQSVHFHSKTPSHLILILYCTEIFKLTPHGHPISFK